MRNHTTPPTVDLAELAKQAMRDRGLAPDFTREAMQQAGKLAGPAAGDDPAVRDLRGLPWASIDNDDSRDLDQLTVAEEREDGVVRVMVAVADVDALVRKGSPLDVQARMNTTSVYTPARIFPMLPERLSTDLTSLNPREDRLAFVFAYDVLPDGSTGDPEVFRARVHSRAKLAYPSVAAWLDGTGPMPEGMAAAEGIAEQMRLQDAAAQRLRVRRFEHGALELHTIEPHAVVEDGKVVSLVDEPDNRARYLIEDFMIAANGVTARYLEARGFPTFRRVVRSPERWDRIEKLAAEYGETLPPDPDSRALNRFLAHRRREDPVGFPDLSLTVVKLMGAGEYMVHVPGGEALGHFGLAVRDYSHSTAPNRRYPDLITHRLLKAALQGGRPAYGPEELNELALHCTEQEDAAKKVERQMRKSAAAQFLSGRLGEKFDAIVTGAAQKGTWVRLLDPPVEGKLTEGTRGLDVGDRLRVKLVAVDVVQGFIDFVRE